MKDEILKILTESELFSINNDINDFKKINISVQKSTDPLPSYINIEESYISILINELIANIYKNVIGYIKKESIVEYYDCFCKSLNRKIGFFAAVVSSSLLTGVEWGALFTKSGFSIASWATVRITSMNSSRVSFDSVSVGSIIID